MRGLGRPSPPNSATKPSLDQRLEIDSSRRPITFADGLMIPPRSLTSRSDILTQRLWTSEIDEIDEIDSIFCRGIASISDRHHDPALDLAVAHPLEDAVDVLKKRLAYGELSVKEYHKLAEALAK